MGISIQTNVTSLLAQQNLRTNTAFQNNTIQQLTSGYRINSSADDAAGLAVANGYRSNVAQLTQGVLNANNGVSVFQTVDGGLSNISQILDRLNTLATESASGTFSGNRTTIDNEYQSLVGEITRQATNIGLNSGGTYNSSLGIYIGGGNNQTNSQINVDLAGNGNAVDAVSLGLSGTSVAGGGVLLNSNSAAVNSVNLNNTAITFLAGGVGSSGTQAFQFNIAGTSTTGTSIAGAASTVTATLSGGANGITGQQAIAQLNNQLNASGITASIGSTGLLQFSGSVGFTLAGVGAASAGNAVATAGATIAANTGFYTASSQTTYSTPTANESFTIQNASGSTNITLTAGAATNATLSATVQYLNQQLVGTGVTAVESAGTTVGTAGTGITFQSNSAFSINETANGTGGTGVFAAAGAQTVSAPTSSSTSTGNADQALLQIQAAVSALGSVQGKIGAGENLLNDAVNLAQSQITNFSAAQSRIRDADIATEAANLTKSQVLQQSSIAALAQANSAPQQLLTLLKG